MRRLSLFRSAEAEEEDAGGAGEAWLVVADGVGVAWREGRRGLLLSRRSIRGTQRCRPMMSPSSMVLMMGSEGWRFWGEVARRLPMMSPPPLEVAAGCGVGRRGSDASAGRPQRLPRMSPVLVLAMRSPLDIFRRGGLEMCCSGASSSPAIEMRRGWKGGYV